MNLNKSKEMYDRAWKEETNERKNVNTIISKIKKLRNPLYIRKYFYNFYNIKMNVNIIIYTQR